MLRDDVHTELETVEFYRREPDGRFQKIVGKRERHGQQVDRLAIETGEFYERVALRSPEAIEDGMSPPNLPYDVVRIDPEVFVHEYLKRVETPSVPFTESLDPIPPAISDAEFRKLTTTKGEV